ncbi:hypothetical protein PILCRDRAFT_810124 [Piloderma croceum F 1598]|uniref:Uncharacterized protein n=1 Tax=Piloderma croceum (strain F 1598) TaxID=765440 RepID=A0A0C3BZY4_PILCF|nr:hypothetical protein PILCRDRAFT_810124 [Piloderma croceum F 1598]
MKVPPGLSGLGSTRAEKNQNSLSLAMGVLNLEATPQCCGRHPTHHTSSSSLTGTTL